MRSEKRGMERDEAAGINWMTYGWFGLIAVPSG